MRSLFSSTSTPYKTSLKFDFQVSIELQSLEYWQEREGCCITTLSETYLLYKADVSSYQEARDALQLQLAAGGPGLARHRRGGDQHLGLLPRQDVPHQPHPLHLHVPALLVSSQEHHNDLDHLSHHGTVRGALSRRMQTDLLPHFRNEIGFLHVHNAFKLSEF